MELGTKVKSVSKSGYLSVGETFFITHISNNRIGLKPNLNTIGKKLTIEGWLHPKTGKDKPDYNSRTRYYTEEEFKERFKVVENK